MKTSSLRLKKSHELFPVVEPFLDSDLDVVFDTPRAGPPGLVPPEAVAAGERQDREEKNRPDEGEDGEARRRTRRNFHLQRDVGRLARRAEPTTTIVVF
jgi:hypothetical protein